MVVVKAGGAAGVDREAICANVAALTRAGESVVLVHGGSAEADHLGTRLGHPPRFLTSPSGVRSRHTDRETLEILTMAIAGRVNPSVVARLLSLGVRAVGLCGVDGGLVLAARKKAIRALANERVLIVRDDLSGQVTRVNVALLWVLIGAGFLPVLSPPALDPEVGPVNVDADRLAAAVAVALEAEELVMLSNVPGLLRDPDDASTLIGTIPAGGFDRCLELARGRMRPKLLAVREALRGGVARVVLGDGRVPEPIDRARAGLGTVADRAALGGVLAR